MFKIICIIIAVPHSDEMCNYQSTVINYNAVFPAFDHETGALQMTFRLGTIELK